MASKIVSEAYRTCFVDDFTSVTRCDGFVGQVRPRVPLSSAGLPQPGALTGREPPPSDLGPSRDRFRVFRRYAKGDSGGLALLHLRLEP